MTNFEKLYVRLPTRIQHFAVSIYGVYWYWLRFGPGFPHYVRKYKQREHFSESKWESWQNSKLIQLLSEASNNIPYYHHAWGIGEKKAALSGKLADLPLLEKNEIRRKPESFLRKDLNPFYRLKHATSGSTGTPITSIWTISEYRNALALRETRSANWAGVSFKMPRATFSGRLVEPDPDSKGPFYRFNAVEKQVYFSAFHLRSDTAYMYVNALHKHKIEWMTGYAFSYFLLAEFILAQKLVPPPLKAVITTSEKLTPKMRNVMEQAYKCRVYEEYSTVENALFASECECGRLHISPDVAIVEILRPDGTCCDPGEVGEVVTTCLMRNYQVFIRYRLGDLAAWDANPCPCGRNMPVIKEVVGRIEDIIVGPDGRQMVRFHGVFVDQPHVREGQIIQESLNLIRVRVVPTNEFGSDDVQDIINRMHQRLGNKVDVLVETVQRIPRSSAGKFRSVVSKLPPSVVKDLTQTSH